MTNGHSAPTPESQNDCILDAATTSGGTTTLKYQRKIDTGDSNDVPIKVDSKFNVLKLTADEWPA